MALVTSRLEHALKHMALGRNSLGQRASAACNHEAPIAALGATASSIRCATSSTTSRMPRIPIVKGHGANSVTAGIWAACGGEGEPPKLFDESFTPANIPSGTPYSKELRLLAHVLTTAEFGDAESVCQAIETFGEDVLGPSGQWLKVAARDKAEVIKLAVRKAPPGGSVLEIGTYCGYSAIRMVQARPEMRVITLEVDPAHMVIARNVVAFAGLAHMIDVWTGHSKDLLQRLPKRYDGHMPISAVFMDQKGSRYDEDLSKLEQLGVLKRGAVIVADNVLKPGAPRFLWRLKNGGAYDTDIVRVKEFAMPSEDWMSFSVLRDVLPEGYVAPVAPEPIQSELLQLQWEADRMRAQAVRAGQGVTYREWSKFADHMKEKLSVHGIQATVESAHSLEQRMDKETAVS